MGDQAPITSFMGIDFDKSQRLQDGTAIMILRLRGPAAQPVLATMWLDFWKAGLLTTIWPGGIPDLKWIIEWAEKPENAIFGCFVQHAGSTDINLVGLGWVVTRTYAGKDDNDNDAYRAEVGFGFLPQVHGTTLPQELAELCLDYGFEELGIISAYGTIPVKNLLAIRFGKRMGFKHIGVFPHYGNWPDEKGVIRPVDCDVSVMTREDWISRGVDQIDEILSRTGTEEVAHGRS
jgi:RimJ/RimL family protein N-acetyltransferase